MSEPSDPVADPPSLEPSDPAVTSVGSVAAAPVDLDAIELDLASVEMALRRLDDGTYFTDEVTGQPISDDVLALNPLARQDR